MFSVDRRQGEGGGQVAVGQLVIIVNCDGQRTANIVASSGSRVLQDMVKSFWGGRGGPDFSKFVPAFREHKVVLEEFLLLSEEDTVRMGVDKLFWCGMGIY